MSVVRTRSRALAAVLCIAGTSAVVTHTAAAQVQPQPAAARAPRDSSGADNSVRWQFDQCMGGLTYGAPLKWALAYGMGYVRESTTSDWCVLGAAKVGLGGASLNVGIANSLGHFGSGAALTAGVLRTFDNPLRATAKRTYVGASLHLWPLLALGGEVGVYTRVGKDPASVTAGRRLIAWSTGFGF